MSMITFTFSSKYCFIYSLKNKEFEIIFACLLLLLPAFFFKKSQIFGGELIICKIGSAGQNYVMPYLNRPVSLGLNQIMVRINNRTIMPYLYQYLNSDYGKQLIDGCINGAVTKSITKTELKKIPVIVPPIELQEQFAAFVEQTDKSKYYILATLMLLEFTRKTINRRFEYDQL